MQCNWIRLKGGSSVKRIDRKEAGVSCRALAIVALAGLAC